MRISTTNAGTMLKRQIAIHAFADWTDARPGVFEVDRVPRVARLRAEQR